jgi:hypothetical protein
MSVLTIPVTTRRETSADISPRLRRRMAKFSASLSAPRGLLAQSEFQSRSAYYSLIAGAVSRLPNNTRDARLALYDRAETALTAELLGRAEITDEQVATERLALEKAFLSRATRAGRKSPDDCMKTGRGRLQSLSDFSRVEASAHTTRQPIARGSQIAMTGKAAITASSTRLMTI